MRAARNVMIRASAGSGKTYELTNRFVALLAAGAKPERIVALTFTRRAAGEFFDEILNKLAGASGDPERARRLAAGIGRPGLGTADFLRLLRAVVDAMHRLRLGTLDSFFASIVRAFPLELGLTGEFEILQEHAARIERQRVLRRLFVGSRAADEQARRDFIEDFKRATFGVEEKRLGPRLDDYLDRHQEIFLAAPAAELWGHPRRIWPRGNPWLDAPGDTAAALRVVREWLAAAAVGAKQRGRWEGFLAAVESWTPGAPLSGELAYVLKKSLDAWPDLAAGRAVLEFDRRRQELSAPAGAALAALVRGVAGGELSRRLAATRGLHAVLRGYEENYHDTVRRAGKLTFGDIQRLLLPQLLTGSSEEAGNGPRRLYIDFRLDSGIDHWLLDEFQDTSFGQWSVLKNLIDEAIQDEHRSFFCVGDAKQSIFTWREGDSRLFGEILEHYNGAAPGTIVEQYLDESRRSGPPLIEMVNAVFGGAAALRSLFPGPASARWSAHWRRHESAVPERQGQAALLHADDAAAGRALTLKIIQEIRPAERGLTCAILVQTNKEGIEIAEYLRREGGVPAVAESDLHVCTDNPLGAALLALFQAAAHPGDRLAWEHLLMTPLGGIIAAERWDDPSALSERILGQVHAEGFERTLEALLRKVEPQFGPEDRFSRERARQFAEAGGLFDQTGSRDLTEFLEFMRRHTIREVESADTIRVMTIHKSKGLGFDVVMLPDLGGNTLFERRDGLAVQRAKDRSVEWILDLPPEFFCRNDPVLHGHLDAAKAEACYEKLSLLYVAMTRAKRALYAIVDRPGSLDSANFPRLLAETLGADPVAVRLGALTLDGAWTAGDSDWHVRMPLPEAAPALLAGMLPLDPAAAARLPRRLAKRPSAERTGTVGAAPLFALESAADFGAAVHDRLAQVEWLGEGGGPPGREFAGAADEEALACLRAPELAAVWTRPAGGGEAWRERPFEVVIEGAWVSGKFDRVVVVRDASGRLLFATVYDFKTDRLEAGADLAEKAAHHRGQLELYRRAAATLTGLPLPAIACELVFTQARRRIPLPAVK